MGLVRPTDIGNVVPAAVAAIDQLEKLPQFLLGLGANTPINVIFAFSTALLCDSSTGAGTTTGFSSLFPLKRPDGSFLTPAAVLGQVGSPASGTQRNVDVNIYDVVAGGFTATLWTPSAAPSVAYDVYFLVIA